jgi:hypothetical protein
MTRDEAFQAIIKFLNDDDWHYETDEENYKINFNLTVKSKLKKVKYLIRVRKDDYVVYVYSPVGGDTDDINEMLRYITKANYGLLNGNFELDLRDGEVRYKTFVDFDGLDSLSTQVIKDSIYIPATIYKKYGDGIAALAMGFSDADTEIKKAEGDNA